MTAQRWLPALFLLSVAVITIFGLTPYGSATTPDSIRYIDVAENLRAGNGIAYRDSSRGNDLVPFTTHPPLYPVALALFLSPDTRPEQASARLSILTLFLAGLLFFELLRPVGREFAVLGALAFMISQPTIMVFTYAWSESLAIPLLLSSCWLALQLVEATAATRSKRTATLLASLTISLALLVWCRYVGVLFAILLPLAWLLTANRRQWLPDFAIASLGLGAMLILLAARNLHRTGFISGSVREPATKTLTDNFTDLWLTFEQQVSDEPAVLIAAALLGLGLFIFKLWGGRTEPGANPPAAQTLGHVHGTRLAILAAVCPVFYFGGLVLLRSERNFDGIDTRLISLGFPLLLLLLCVGVFRGLQALRGSLPGAAVLGMSALLLLPVVAQGISSYREAVSSWALRGSPRFPVPHDSHYTNLNTRSRALQEEARLALDDQRYVDALIALDQSLTFCDNPYPVHRAMAQAYAGVGDVENSLRNTRECLRLDPDRALKDIPGISRPFWHEARLHRSGIDYYRQLATDLPDAAWLQQKIAGLATMLGDRALAVEALKRARRLESEQSQ